ncbi:polysaccharide deacetylase [Clostridia bacterium]|nr:polysaccharide deacetylase [Clostridia bacterium]
MKRIVAWRSLFVVVVSSLCFVAIRYRSNGSKGKATGLAPAVEGQVPAAAALEKEIVKEKPKPGEFEWPTDEPIVGALPEAAKKYGFDAREIAKRLKAWDFSALKFDSPTSDGKQENSEKKLEKKVVFLTFDDGPSSNNTPQILDILKKEKVHATFFIVGYGLEKEESREVLKRELAEGYAIGTHTYSHDYKKLYPGRILNIENFKAELEMCNNKCKEVLGKNFKTRIVRCPGGSMSWKGMAPLTEYFDQNNMASLDWNVEIGDAQGRPKKATQLVEYMKSKMNPDTKMVVLLMHDSNTKGETVKALRKIIKYFKDNEFEFKILV